MSEEQGKKKIRTSGRAVSVICNIFILLFFLACVGALFYPWLSERANRLAQREQIHSYNRSVEHMDADLKERLLREAQAYNARLLEEPIGYQLNEEQMAEYNRILDVSGDGALGVMGHISIPSIKVSLLIYHSVEDSVLSMGVGHLPGSSVPVGGVGTHSILSGHTGLTSATLFTNLNKLEIGDVFQITVLEDVLTYEVDQIETVLPYQIDLAKIEPGKDLCTLVTCTPYGVNSHRLLVRGHRIETPRTGRDGDESGSYSNLVSAGRTKVGMDFADWLAVAGCVVLALGIFVFVWRRKKRPRHRGKREK